MQARWRPASHFIRRRGNGCPTQIRRASSTLSQASEDLRRLMRKVAQPVAVITANLKDLERVDSPDHGATVSSFVSIAMSPSPLVAFALRLPSRLATFLNRNHDPSRSQVPCIKIHLLAQGQVNLAKGFARQPPRAKESNPAAPSSSSTFDPFPKEYFEQLESSSLGMLECSVIGSVHLDDPLPGLFERENQEAEPVGTGDPSQATSQLFIAKALKVYVRESVQDPLLYCHQGYYKLEEK